MYLETPEDAPGCPSDSGDPSPASTVTTDSLLHSPGLEWSTPELFQVESSVSDVCPWPGYLPCQ